jgi:hypothetical protein
VKRALISLLVLLSVLAPGAARAQGAGAQGWWTQVNGVVPPDVGATDLLLQGGDPARALPSTGGVVDQSPKPTALAALSFTVAPGSRVGPLVLQVASGGQAGDVRAYPVKAPWVPVQGGALADAPVPELSRYSAGTLSPDGASLVFPDIGRLATEAGLLSVVLVPGATDRVVVHQPTGTALTVAAPELATAPSRPVPPGQAAPQVPVPTGPPIAAIRVLPRVDSVVLPGVAAPAAPAPSVAAAPAPVAVAPVAAAALTRRLVPDDGRSRLIVVLEIALVVGFFGLMGQGPLAQLARLTGAQGPVDETRGIGRFRTVRSGRTPRL